MSKTYTVSFSTKHPTRKDENGVPVSIKASLDIDRPQTIAEAVPAFWSEEELVSLAVRDENTNVGNVARAALVSALEDGKSDEEAIKLSLEAAARYEAGEKTKRTGAGKLAKILQSIMMKAATGDAKAVQAMQDIAKNPADYAKIAEAFGA
jgi:hypothetical protein